MVIDHAAPAGGFNGTFGHFLLHLGDFVLHDAGLAYKIIHVAHYGLLERIGWGEVSRGTSEGSFNSVCAPPGYTE